MSLRHKMIGATLESLSAIHADRWLPMPSNMAGFVVTLHHVRPAGYSEFDPNGLLSISPEFLDLFIAQFQSEGWEFVSVDELARVSVQGAPERRRIAVTLDDGFVDNLEIALPVFRRRRVPFTIFVVPGFCDNTAAIWWEALERIIAKKYEVGLQGDEGPPPVYTRTSAEKLSCFQMWVKFLTTMVDETGQREIITRLAAENQVDLAELASELIMSWEEIIEIAADPLCTIGAHTMTHPALARLPLDEARREMSQSADVIQHQLGHRPTSFAFPYGYAAAAGRREAALARELGFATSFTTRPGYVPRSGSRHGLPRISINGLYQKAYLQRTLMTPGLWSIRNLFRPGSAVLGN